MPQSTGKGIPLSALTIGVVGLGRMGLGMAANAAARGFRTLGSDPSPERVALAQAKGVVALRLADLFAASDVVIASLPTADVVATVVEAPDGFLAKAPEGAVFVDTSTSEAGVSRRLAVLAAEKGLGFIDAPVSGGPAGAEAGTLTMMIGGEAGHLARVLPALEAISAKRLHVGGPGAGNVAKLVNNLLVGAHLLTVSEAVRLSEAAGVPAADVLAVVNAASGRSAVSEVNYPRWVLNGGFDSGFTMGLMRKDVRLAAALATEVGVDLPVSDLVARIWADSAALIADGEDFNRIVEDRQAP
ncbi:NAD(P)-dependent oxidoreductase [Phreatobacter sp.]|uniref:NAD(P)-dependent oxidoreductase n=1 Tax=Phreatobacter sp. TaxID=1966341 RepID=UPI0022BBC6D9|nr:NAD(P)-dependent oxidoreductase [Phreatobacter sp.]MCZ8314646.1 NAD(P)-dependent oxidoreductase [Phreatobacter sp.]